MKKIEKSTIKPSPKLTEHQIQSAYFRWVYSKSLEDSRYSMIHAVPNGGLRSAKDGAMMKREGVKRGVFDIYCMIQKKGYGALLIETKTKSGKLSIEQKKYFKLYQQQNYFPVVCYSLKEMIEVTEWYLND